MESFSRSAAGDALRAAVQELELCGRAVCASEQIVESSIATGRENFEIQLRKPSDVQTVWAVFCNCNYQVPEAPSVVLDLGANIGTFSIYAAKVKHREKNHCSELSRAHSQNCRKISRPTDWIPSSPASSKASVRSPGSALFTRARHPRTLPCIFEAIPV